MRIHHEGEVGPPQREIAQGLTAPKTASVPCPFLPNLVTLSGETLSGETFVGRNYSSGEIFVTFQKIRHFRPTKFRPIRYLKEFSIFFHEILMVARSYRVLAVDIKSLLISALGSLETRLKVPILAIF